MPIRLSGEKEARAMKENSVIHLKGLEFFGYHGLLDEERKLGQRFVVDADIFPNKWIKKTDAIMDTIDYVEVYNVIKECVEVKRFNLLESLAEEIALIILDRFPCSKVRLEVHKPSAPIPGIFRDVSIEIIRGRVV